MLYRAAAHHPHPTNDWVLPILILINIICVIGTPAKYYLFRYKKNNTHSHIAEEVVRPHLFTDAACFWYMKKKRLPTFVSDNY